MVIGPPQEGRNRKVAMASGLRTAEKMACLRARVIVLSSYMGWQTENPVSWVEKAL